MSDLFIRKSGRAGRITLTRPQVLNALSWQMCRDIHAALESWRADDEVALVLIDAEGERAFSAGGDIQEIYATGMRGDFDYGRRFWADEYRMNAAIDAYPKPVVTLLQGFTMGGGVGLGCHASHRVVCETSQIAMPEAAIGLVPDVGGTYLLANAPGHLGEYLAASVARMGPADAIHAGFADHYIPREFWLDLVEGLLESGNAALVAELAEPLPPGPITMLQSQIDQLFAGDAAGIIAALEADGSDFVRATRQAVTANSPLAIAAGIVNIRTTRAEGGDIISALKREYRFTSRAVEHGDFLEGIRAAVIDKDKSPHWQHASLAQVSADDVAAMLAPLGAEEWQA